MRYFLCPIIGDGTIPPGLDGGAIDNSFRPKLPQGYTRAALIPSAPSGRPKFPWVLVAVQAPDYAEALVDPTLFPLPDLHPDATLWGTLYTAVVRKMDALSIPTGDLSVSVPWRYILRKIGRHLEADFDESRHLILGPRLAGGALPIAGGAPGIICSDTFNRADSDILGTLDNGLGGSGSWSWTETVTDIDIVSSQAKHDSASNWYARAKVTEAVGTDNYKVTADHVYQSASSDSGPAGRIVDANNFKAYVLGDSGIGNLRFWKQVSGSFTSLYSATKTVSADVTLRLELNGNNWELFYGGASESSGTDSANPSGAPGIGYAMTGKGGIVDKFILEDFAAAEPVYPQLERNRRGIMRGVMIGA